MKSLILAALLVNAAAAAPKKAPPKVATKEETSVAETIDVWHLAASEHSEDAYFSLMSKDFVFFGTDPHERWNKAAFQKWAHPIFAKGKGWTIKSLKRNIFFGPEKHVAWFDEDVDSKEFGPARGTGVLVRDVHGKWKMSQYNLSVPIPNEKFDEVLKVISGKPAKE